MADKSVDLILTDPPYGTTACKWDSIIPFDKMWEQLNRIIKSYKPILIKSDNAPEIDSSCILRISEFSDLIDAQAEIRKPIYYVSTNDSTAFYLLDDTVCLVYLLKTDEDVVSPLEVKLREQELKNNYDSLDLDKLTNIEKTLVLSYKDKSVKISPVRDNNTNTQDVSLKEEEPMIYQNLSLVEQHFYLLKEIKL